MRLTRIYQPRPLSIGETLILPGAAGHHLMHVLRMPVGAAFVIFNGQGGEFEAKIVSSDKDHVSARIERYDPVSRESPLKIILGQAVIRPEKMDYVLQKTVELGVTEIILLLTERSFPKLPPERWGKRLTHWRAVVAAACEQSGRTRVPVIAEPVPFNVAVEDLAADHRIILTPHAVQMASSHVTTSTTCMGVLVGPEGGWSKTEMNLAIAAGYISASLGPRILRTETAGLVAVTLLQSVFGDISWNLV